MQYEGFEFVRYGVGWLDVVECGVLEAVEDELGQAVNRLTRESYGWIGYYMYIHGLSI